MLIDTHCHLQDREFFSAEQAEEILKRARERGVQKIICIGTDPEDSLVARDFAASHPDVYWTYGVHPENASKIATEISLRERTCAPKMSYAGSLAEPSPAETNLSGPSGIYISGRANLEMPSLGTFSVANNSVSTITKNIQAITSNAPVAIGEVGLDYHYPGYDRGQQIKLFEEMLQLAKDTNLPVSFHVREAFVDFFPIIENFPGLTGVVHSFSDSKKNLRRILENTEFYIGVNGLATYSTLPTPPLKRIVLETDAPFLTPVPFRGIINESGHIPEIAKWLSGKLALDYETIEKETTENARKLFHI